MSDAPPRASGPILVIMVGAMLTLCAGAFAAGHAVGAWQAQCEAVE